MEQKYCKICGKKLCSNNKSGYCKYCYPKYCLFGENNPFYGKKHTQETKDLLKIKCAEATKKMWENQEYREKVIKNATGLKRSDEFKEKQREHALQQFQDNNQRELRSKKMAKTWEEGKIAYSPNTTLNRSKQEKKFIELLSQEIQDEEILVKQTLHNGKKYFFPDAILPKKKIIIEYNGNFWHADPDKYKENDIIHKNITAKEIWEKDALKKDAYNELGYMLITVWQKDFLKNKEECVKQIAKQINEYGNQQKL